MKVCIAEKPSVAKEIALILGAKHRKDGFFEGNGYQVTWTFGHLCTLKEPHDYHDSLKFWNLRTLPIIPTKFGIKLIKNKGVKEQFGTIKKLVTEAEEVINCGDAGQEGELIQRWVLQNAGYKKPMKRLWISSLTEEAIREGFNHLKNSEDYDRLYWAGSSRAIGDWLLGINATRLYTLKYGQKGSVLSIGRVQTPTLAMIVSRHKEIENFTSKKFWELGTIYKGVKFSSEKGKFDEKDQVENLKKSLENTEFKIISFERKEGKEGVPKLFDLTSLQVECNKKLSLGADQTLKIAQTLYERKYITYPRVDTQYLPDDIYPTIKGILSSMKSYQLLIAPLLEHPIKKSKGVFNNKKVTDHHAIIPTNIDASSLAGQEKQVYDIIAKRFIANFYPDCKIAKTTVKGQAVEIKFKATGKEILEPGWRSVYGKEQVAEEDNKEQEENQLLPSFLEGETGPHKPFIKEKETKPPKPFTEATLLRAMETAGKQVDDEEVRDLMKENGIGRPSTRANIIQTLFRRKYIRQQRKSLEPTITGIQLIDTIQSDLLKSAELTGKWEKNLRDIESGEYEVKNFMTEMKTMVSDLVKQVKFSDQVSKIAVAEELGKKKSIKKTTPDKIICPKCKKGNILKGKAAYGCSEYKAGCSFILPFVFNDKKLTDSQLTSILIKGKSGQIKGIKHAGEKKEGHLLLNKELNLEFIPKEKTKLNCPKCKKGIMIKGKQAYGCDRYREGCKVLIPFTYLGKKLSQKQIEDIILKGRSSLIKGFINTSGETLNGRIIINNEFQIQLTKA